MSQTDVPPTPPPPDARPVACPRCAAPLRPDQDWCLNCGAAVTTEVAGAPAWRTPIAIVGAVLAVSAVALVLAFLELSNDAEQVAQAPAPTPAPPAAVSPVPTPVPTTGAIPGLTPTPGAGGTPTPGATPTTTPDGTATPTPTPTPASGGAFADWPAGETAYTVVLWSAGSRSEAETKAEQFRDAGQSGLGILDSDDYSTLRPGYFVVFSGQYEGRGAAQDAARAAQSASPGAYARQVKPK